MAASGASNTDRPGARLAALLRYGLGQRRLVDPEELGAGLLHVVIFAAFAVLAARTVTLFGMGFDPAFHLPLLAPDSAPGRAYGALKEWLVLLALLASAGFLWRRLVTKPDRLTASWEGTLILGFILGLMVTEMMFDGAERALAAAPFDAAAPAGSLAAAAYAGLGLSPGAVAALGQAGFWLHLVLILVFRRSPRDPGGRAEGPPARLRSRRTK